MWSVMLLDIMRSMVQSLKHCLLGVPTCFVGKLVTVFSYCLSTVFMMKTFKSEKMNSLLKKSDIDIPLLFCWLSKLPKLQLKWVYCTTNLIVKTTTQPQHNPKTTPKQSNTIQRKLGLTRLLVCTTYHHPPTTGTFSLRAIQANFRVT